LSYEHACKLEVQLNSEVAKLLKAAELADKADILDGMNVPEEIQRREQRLKGIAAAKTEIERRAAERHTREQAAYEEKVAARTKKAEETGKKPKGKQPKPPTAGPSAKDRSA
jgi:hypothetical protein